jgi:PncC family amidohydrolase
LSSNARAERLVEVLKRKGATLAFAESCTGGLASAAITAIPGSSACFKGAIVAYSNEAKRDLLDVDPDTLSTFGAVSNPCAEAMALGARARLGARIAVSITGIAGPSGGTDEKPIGTVCFSVASRGNIDSATKHFKGSRRKIREQATAFAIGLALEAAEKLPDDQLK